MFLLSVPLPTAPTLPVVSLLLISHTVQERIEDLQIRPETLNQLTEIAGRAERQAQTRLTGRTPLTQAAADLVKMLHKMKKSFYLCAEFFQNSPYISPF